MSSPCDWRGEKLSPPLGRCLKRIRTGVKPSSPDWLLLFKSVLGAIHYFKLFSTRTHRPRNPSTKTHCWHLWFGLEGAVLSLWCLHELLESLSSLNSYSNSRRSRPVGFVSDDPTRAHPFLMSARLLLWAVGCLSPGRQKEGEHPAPPSAPPRGRATW